ncbi:hypothetical protein [Flexivirga meconopsidis]|uniref:hypothetical protein n=1 Tax=Flexivirga meconopsidis TaxID=2977121 RepID=UPI0022407C8F|nr:hypothetical protein [Flexivirga meconopsidis]
MAPDEWLNRIDEELAPPVEPLDKGKPANVVFELAEPLSPHRASHPEAKSEEPEDTE